MRRHLSANAAGAGVTDTWEGQCPTCGSRSDVAAKLAAAEAEVARLRATRDCSELAIMHHRAPEQRDHHRETLRQLIFRGQLSLTDHGIRSLLRRREPWLFEAGK